MLLYIFHVYYISLELSANLVISVIAFHKIKYNITYSTMLSHIYVHVHVKEFTHYSTKYIVLLRSTVDYHLIKV